MKGINLRNKFAIAVIALGIIVLLIPFMSDLLLNIMSRQNIGELDRLTSDDLADNQLNEGDFDFNNVQDVSITRTLIGSRSFDKNLIIGQLVIPDIDLNLPIVKGVSETSLMVGAGTMKASQKMGLGNYALAGHYINRKDTLFGGLMDIKEGSLVMITNKKNVYEYQIYERITVEDEEIEFISDSKSEEREKPIISLMTCYYSSKTGKRFFAIGELVREYPYENWIY